MKKYYAIKNIENHKYFTGKDYQYWSLDISDAQLFDTRKEAEEKIEMHSDKNNTLDSFNLVNFATVKLLYIKN